MWVRLAGACPTVSPWVSLISALDSISFSIKWANSSAYPIGLWGRFSG